MAVVKDKLENQLFRQISGDYNQLYDIEDSLLEILKFRPPTDMLTASQRETWNKIIFQIQTILSSTIQGKDIVREVFLLLKSLSTAYFQMKSGNCDLRSTIRAFATYLSLLKKASDALETQSTLNFNELMNKDEKSILFGGSANKSFADVDKIILENKQKLSILEQSMHGKLITLYKGEEKKLEIQKRVSELEIESKHRNFLVELHESRIKGFIEKSEMLDKAIIAARERKSEHVAAQITSYSNHLQKMQTLAESRRADLIYAQNREKSKIMDTISRHNQALIDNPPRTSSYSYRRQSSWFSSSTSYSYVSGNSDERAQQQQIIQQSESFSLDYNRQCEQQVRDFDNQNAAEQSRMRAEGDRLRSLMSNNCDELINYLMALKEETESLLNRDEQALVEWKGKLGVSLSALESSKIDLTREEDTFERSKLLILDEISALKSEMDLTLECINEQLQLQKNAVNCFFSGNAANFGTVYVLLEKTSEIPRLFNSIMNGLYGNFRKQLSLFVVRLEMTIKELEENLDFIALENLNVLEFSDKLKDIEGKYGYSQAVISEGVTGSDFLNVEDEDLKEIFGTLPNFQMKKLINLKKAKKIRQAGSVQLALSYLNNVESDFIVISVIDDTKQQEAE